MAMSKKSNALGSSFMFLSFATAVLLIAVQTRGMFTASTGESIARTETSKQQSVAVGEPVSSSSASTAQTAEPGIADILSTSFHPVALLNQPQVVVDLSDRQVYLYQNGELHVSYGIAVGREGWETPAGDFSVLTMQENPLWQNPLTGETVSQGADNPLGSRWIGFWTDGTHQIGFHGTNQEELIGQAVSHGCIRMRNPDIQALYSQIAVGTPVNVRP